MFSSHPREATVCIQGTTLAPPSVKRDMAMLTMLLDGLSWVVKSFGTIKRLGQTYGNTRGSGYMMYGWGCIITNVTIWVFTASPGKRFPETAVKVMNLPREVLVECNWTSCSNMFQCSYLHMFKIKIILMYFRVISWMKLILRSWNIMAAGSVLAEEPLAGDPVLKLLERHDLFVSSQCIHCLSRWFPIAAEASPSTFCSTK